MSSIIIIEVICTSESPFREANSLKLAIVVFLSDLLILRE